MLGLVSVGATLPVLPRYVRGPLGDGDLAVGRRHRGVRDHRARLPAARRPLRRPARAAAGGDRGRRVSTAIAGLLYFVPAGVGGLIVARLFLGAGEGLVYTAGSAWVVDLAPPERRGRIIGLYGLAIWGGLSLGPPIGELILHATSFEGVWAFAAGAPLVGRADRDCGSPSGYEPRAARPRDVDRRLIAREALRPGLGLSLAIVGYATVAAFIVLHLDERQVGHGAGVFTAFAVSVVAMRVLGGGLPGPLRLDPVRDRRRADRGRRAAADRVHGLAGRRRSPARWRWAPASRCCSPRWRSW